MIYRAYNETPTKGIIMLRTNNSVNDAMKIMCNRAEAAKTSFDNAKKRRVSIRTKQIATAAGYVVGVAAGIIAVAAIVQNTSKAEYIEDED
jgi:hypothetical protein